MTRNRPILNHAVARRLQQLRELGFNYFLISNATYGVPRAVRHETIRLFAEEVMPRVLDEATAVAEHPDPYTATGSTA